METQDFQTELQCFFWNIAATLSVGIPLHKYLVYLYFQRMRFWLTLVGGQGILQRKQA